MQVVLGCIEVYGTAYRRFYTPTTCDIIINVIMHLTKRFFFVSRPYLRFGFPPTWDNLCASQHHEHTRWLGYIDSMEGSLVDDTARPDWQ